MSLEMKYFVLKPGAKTKDDVFAKASQEGMLKFADRIAEVDSDLAREVIQWSRGECIKQARLEPE